MSEAHEAAELERLEDARVIQDERDAAAHSVQDGANASLLREHYHYHNAAGASASRWPNVPAAPSGAAGTRSPPTTTISIIGSIGAGKSTLIENMMRTNFEGIRVKAVAESADLLNMLDLAYSSDAAHQELFQIFAAVDALHMHRRAHSSMRAAKDLATA